MMHSPKHLADTSASFYPLPNSQNQQKQSALDFGFLRQQQHQRISYIFRKDGVLSEEQLLFEIEKAEEETNAFISSLLEQLAEQTRKNRNMQLEHDVLMREKQSQGRKLAEHSIEVTASVNAERKMWEQERRQLQRQIKENSRTAKYLQKECDGMRKLLQQYQNQLEISNIKKEYYEAAIIDDKDKLQLFLTKIDQLTIVVARKQSECDKLNQKKQLRNQRISQLQEKIEQLQKELEQSKINNDQHKALKQECILLKKQKNQQAKLIQHLQINLLVANGDAVKHQYLINDIQSSKTRQAEQYISRQNDLRQALSQLQSKTKLSMDKLKQSYSKRMRKIISFYNKEIKNLKSNLNGMRQTIQKEILIGFKLMQRDFRQQNKCILHY